MWLRVLLLVCAVCLMTTSVMAQYTNLDRNGNYRGYIDKGDTRIDFYGKDNMPRGWIDRSSGAVYDRNNNFGGWIIESDRDRN